MQRVLDIDLDYFLANCCPLAEPGERPVLWGHEPWDEEAVRCFLEKQCLLSREHPVPGRVFETHDGALCYWHELMTRGMLRAPFHVTHVDAHSDLGIGYPGPGYVLYNVLSMPPSRRLELDRFYGEKKLDEANYLLFALAFPEKKKKKNGPEPCIPYHEYKKDGSFLAAARYDFVSLAISPRYAPQEADRLIPVIQEYMLR